MSVRSFPGATVSRLANAVVVGQTAGFRRAGLCPGNARCPATVLVRRAGPDVVRAGQVVIRQPRGICRVVVAAERASLPGSLADRVAHEEVRAGEDKFFHLRRKAGFPADGSVAL